MTDKRKIPISAPDMGEEEWQALREPIMSGWLTQGAKVGAFEQAFAEYHGVRHAIACSSCTTALHLALVGLELGPEDEVIVPAFTWISTANAILYCGATPVFADVDRRSFNVTPETVACRVTQKTRAVIIVHLFGLCADVIGIRTALPQHVKVIEDAACAAGADLAGQAAGSLGDVGVFSFHPRKVITTGEGGMLTTNSDLLAKRVISLRNHGASVPEEVRHQGPKPYILPNFDVLGFNYRMTDLQGALGLVQLRKLDRLLRERAASARFYTRELAGLQWLRLPEEPEGSRHAWQAFVTAVEPDTAPKPRDEIMEYLERRGISVRPGTHAVHMQGYYRARFGLQPDAFPHARDCAQNSLAIPLHNRMTEDDFVYVVEALRGIQ